MGIRSRSIGRHRVTSPPAATTITVNFAGPSVAYDAVKAFGICVTGYTGDAGDMRNSTLIQSQTATLAPGTYRLGFKWDSVNNIPLNGASSGVGLGDDWVSGINLTKIPGSEITGLLEGEVTFGGNTYHEMGITPEDAAAIVHYYNDNGGQHGGPIKYWMVGNEPDLVGQAKYDYLQRDMHDGRAYGDLWLRIYEAVKEADPTILVGGATSAQYIGHTRPPGTEDAYTPGSIERFWNAFMLQETPGIGKVADLVDFCDSHFYGGGTAGSSDTPTVMTRTAMGKQIVDSMRSLVNAYSTSGTRGNTIPIIVSELNWAYQAAYGGLTGKPYTLIERTDGTTKFDGRFSMATSLAFLTTFIIQVLRPTYPAVPGWVQIFGDLVGPLGLYTRNNLGDRAVIGNAVKYYPHDKPAGTPYPAYYALGMFTGMGLFRRFGNNIVQTSGGATNIQSIASTDDTDVMIVNRDEAITRNITLAVSGVSDGTSVAVWSTNRLEPWNPPRQIATKTVTSGQITGIPLPPMTAVRVVVG